MPEDGFPRCVPLPNSKLVPFGRVAARERQEVLSRRAWLFSIRCVRTRFGQGGGQQLDRRRARGGLNPCARESKARTGRLLRGKLISDHGHFLSTRATRSDERARFVGLFHGCTGLWTAGCWLARRLHQLKASATMDLGISISLTFVRCVVFRWSQTGLCVRWSYMGAGGLSLQVQIVYTHDLYY